MTILKILKIVSFFPFYKFNFKIFSPLLSKTDYSTRYLEEVSLLYFIYFPVLEKKIAKSSQFPFEIKDREKF